MNMLIIGDQDVQIYEGEQPPLHIGLEEVNLHILMRCDPGGVLSRRERGNEGDIYEALGILKQALRNYAKKNDWLIIELAGIERPSLKS